MNMDEILVPVIKEEPISDSEADPLSNIDLRKVKVGYVKKFPSWPCSKIQYESSVSVWYFSDIYVHCSEAYPHLQRNRIWAAT